MFGGAETENVIAAHASRLTRLSSRRASRRILGQAIATLVAALAISTFPAALRAAPAEAAVVTVAKLPPPDLAANASSAEADYVIGPLDTLEIKVYPQSDLGGEVQVDVSGKVEMPLIGSVPAAGKTARQLGDEMAAELDAKYVVSPSVAVQVKDSVTNKYTVTGAVVRPGVYDVVGEVTLMQAVAVANGANELANTHSIVIFRKINGKRAAGVVDLDAVLKGKIDDPRIYPGDVIVIGTSSAKRAIHNLAGVTPLLFFLTPLGL